MLTKPSKCTLSRDKPLHVQKLADVSTITLVPHRAARFAAQVGG